MRLTMILAAVLLISCQTAEQVDPLSLTGRAAEGETLATQPLLGDPPVPGCRNCHALEDNVVLVGPSFPMMSEQTERDLLESIIHPNAVVAAEYKNGGMYDGYQKALTPQEIADLIAFIKSFE